MQAVAASRGLDAGGGGLVGAVPRASTGWADGGGGRWPARVVDGVPAGVAGRAVEDPRRRTGGRWAWEEAGVGLGVPRVSSWAGLNLGHMGQICYGFGYFYRLTVRRSTKIYRLNIYR